MRAPEGDPLWSRTKELFGRALERTPPDREVWPREPRDLDAFYETTGVSGYFLIDIGMPEEVEDLVLPARESLVAARGADHEPVRRLDELVDDARAAAGTDGDR